MQSESCVQIVRSNQNVAPLWQLNAAFSLQQLGSSTVDENRALHAAWLLVTGREQRVALPSVEAEALLVWARTCKGWPQHAPPLLVEQPRASTRPRKLPEDGP